MILDTQRYNDLNKGLFESIAKAKLIDCSVLFSYTFSFEAHDLLPLLSHPADKNKCRIYWEQPIESFSLAGLGKILELSFDNSSSLDLVNKKISNYFDNATHITN